MTATTTPIPLGRLVMTRGVAGLVALVDRLQVENRQLAEARPQLRGRPGP